ncbi:hypothetical protein BDA99DRAFT_4352 [Phascolomyces articulosus]|uniref:Uncharacterized protein n=1 Tax=Phascolomyces articulosus TaxID=60185 RepID=A0AAD5PJ64_9FUNG|nr:hypothetical protein BDA99DRAFT_4352 [Phascolomyces articulosus]
MYSSSHYSPPRSQDYRISDPYSSRMYPRRRSRSRSRSSERYYSERLSSGLSYVPHQRTRDEYPENRPRRHASPSPPPPRPATPPNGMTGTNLIPLASRKPHISQMETNVSSATKNASAATIPTVPAATLPVVTETTANTIPAILAIGEAPIPPGLSVTAQVRQSSILYLLL